MKISESSIDDYVNYRLEQWVDWYLRGNQYGLGYPKKSIAARLMEEGGVLINSTANYSPPTHAAAEEVEMMVKDLAKQNPKIALALRVQYFNVGTAQSKARQAGLSYSQFKVHLDMAKQWIAGRLSAKMHFN